MNLFSERSLPDEAIDYLTHLEKKGRQPSTLKRYAYDLEDFFLWLRTQTQPSWRDISNRELQDYFDFLQGQKNYSLRTSKRIVTVLKRFYGHFRELGVVATNPAANVVLNEDSTNSSFLASDFISSNESARLFRSVPSFEGLSENQHQCRKYLADRNLAILTLFLHYGPTLTELVSIRMRDVFFERNKVAISSVSSLSRTIELKVTDMKLLYSYYSKIPKAVRPHRHSNDPLFVAFDFQRNTYRWDYSSDRPKALTEIAVQKMIRQEIRRAGLREGISAQHLRRTCILQLLHSGETNEKVQKLAGMKSKLSLKKYIDFLQQKSPGTPGD